MSVPNSSEFRKTGALYELELRYDGPIPEAERQYNLYDPVTFRQAGAIAETAFFAALIRRQIRAIRRRRAVGLVPGALLDDLASYRRQYHAWRRRVGAPQNSEAPPTEGGASDRWLNHHPIHDRV
ncbi:MAG: hypothetical protein JWL84_4141 [Rhodospirillales bacterium]|jgi:hypothetical protein|nr:hypothetical protein [Rhodospirillales bacterium]